MLTPLPLKQQQWLLLLLFIYVYASNAFVKTGKGEVEKTKDAIPDGFISSPSLIITAIESLNEHQPYIKLNIPPKRSGTNKPVSAAQIDFADRNHFCVELPNYAVKCLRRANSYSLHILRVVMIISTIFANSMCGHQKRDQKYNSVYHQGTIVRVCDKSMTSPNASTTTGGGVVVVAVASTSY
uniref:Uncharacterized protein n=1 Tax=Glossina brevipalpis TaxID=37001 RepID=A0A1A9W3W0_9MUSC